MAVLGLAACDACSMGMGDHSGDGNRLAGVSDREGDRRQDASSACWHGVVSGLDLRYGHNDRKWPGHSSPLACTPGGDHIATPRAAWMAQRLVSAIPIAVFTPETYPYSVPVSMGIFGFSWEQLNKLFHLSLFTDTERDSIERGLSDLEKKLK